MVQTARTKRMMAGGARTSAVLLAFVLAQTVLAQSDTQPAPEDGADKPLLSGPTVDDSGRLQEEGFGEMDAMAAVQNRKAAGGEVSIRNFRAAIRSLNDTDLALTGEQREEVEGLLRPAQRATFAYLVEHRNELNALADAAGIPADQRPWMGQGRRRGPTGESAQEKEGAPGPERGTVRGGDPQRGRDEAANPRERRGGARMNEDGEDGQDRAMRSEQAEPTKEQAVAIERLKALRAGAPSVAGAVESSFAILSGEQRDAVRAELERAQAERRDNAIERRGMREAEDRERARENETPGDREARQQDQLRRALVSALKPDGTLDPSKLPERLRERYESIDESRRERFVETLKERAGID